MQINGRKIGPGHPPYIIGEISGNHGGSFDKACLLLGMAIGAGAHAAKLQCYTPDSLTLDCDRDDFVLKDGPWKGRTLYELYQKAHTPLEWFPELFALAKRYNFTLFSSVFDEQGLELLEGLGCPAYKIASMEIIDLPLIRRVVETGKPIILSTGMASLEEVDDAIVECLSVPHAVLHCVSGYPAAPHDFNLTRMKSFGVKTHGISDHTLGWEIPVAATAMGASIIEKHICVSRDDKIEDAGFSLEPEEFKQMCGAVSSVWKAINFPSSLHTEDSSRVLRRSLYVTADIKKDDPFTKDNIRSIRPAYGMPPKELPNVLGKVAKRDIKRGEPLKGDMIG